MTRKTKNTQQVNGRGSAPSMNSTDSYYNASGNGTDNDLDHYHNKMHIVPAGHGYAFEVKKGDQFRIIDIHGKQVVDFAAWVLPDMLEKLSMAYTRFRLAGATPMVGECLITNKDDPLFRLVADTVKVHDMTFPSCFPELYEKLGLQGHRSCAANFAEVMKPYGMKNYLEVTDPFNVFQNTPNYTIKALNSSRPGDFVQLEALKDTVCAVSCCPYDQNGFNGGTITDIAVIANFKVRENARPNLPDTF